MTSFRLIFASLRFYWRTQLGVLAGVILATAVLVGAMVVGDSVRQSLHDLALARLGETRLAMVPHERFYRVQLAQRMSESLGAPVAPVLLLPGTATNQRDNERANSLQVIGMNQSFGAIFAADTSVSSSAPLQPPPPATVYLNAKLASELRVKQGDAILLRVSKPSLLPRDAPLTRTDASDISLALRVTVAGVFADNGFAIFSLQASQVTPRNAFLDLQWLQEQLKLSEQANVMLVGPSASPGNDLTAGKADAVIRERWRLADVNLEVRRIPDQPFFELRSSRIFLDPPLAAAAIEAGKDQNTGVLGVLTYLVNEFDAGTRKAPYSMATAVGVLHSPSNDWLINRPSDKTSWQDLLPESENPQSPPSPEGGSSMQTIILNDWLANDLKVKQGDTIRLKYFTVGPSRELVEQTSEPFIVELILPIEGPAADRTFLPDFPDLPGENTTFSQWKPGFKMTRQVRKVDDDYWAKHRGTPKAFLPLAVGRQMWGNRFGDLTAIRFHDAGVDQSKLEAAIRSKIDPATLGLSFIPVRKDALAASSQGFDFAQLFLGFSFFLIVASLLLTGLLFVFAIEQRAAEVGTLLAVGFRPRQVRRLLLGEGLLLAVIGAAVGVVLGLVYTRLLLHGLTTIWRDAISTSSLVFHAKPVTLIIGFSASVAVALFTIWLVLRKQARMPARDLLAGASSSASAPSHGNGRIAFIAGSIFTLVALALLAAVGIGRGTSNAGAFFGAGSMLLIAGLFFCSGTLRRLAAVSSNPKSPVPNPQSPIAISLSSLAFRNAARRRGRSLATVGLLASGAFLVIAIGAFWLDSSENARDRKSGTGGFALYGESTLPVLADLNTAEGLDKFALERADLPGVSVIPMRVRDGDDASCLNLNRAQNPRLVGIPTQRLAELDPFSFASAWTARGRYAGWLNLCAGCPDGYSPEEGVVSAIGDANTVTYGLGLAVGDTLYYADELGRAFKVRIVATMSNSILQGSLFIDEEQFKQRFPSVAGHRAFLIDAPWDKVVETKKKLEAALGDVGLQLTPTVERLAAFNAVQNTYLGIFQMLGGLGLLLGSIGLGIVVLRNVLERRSELALLAAVGFTAGRLRALVQGEHRLLLLLGLIVGVLSAAIAVLPAVLSPGATVPYALLGAILAGVIVTGLLFTSLATRLALRGPLLAALRNE
jgi:ABC-type antimicrobial peptide transport system permease subunit